MTSSKSKLAGECFLRSHDYRWLVHRWKTAARDAGLRLSRIGTSGDHAVYMLRSKAPPSGAFRLYLSAGIHGDESATTEALLSWVARKTTRLRNMDLTIFPCLNPWGLAHNKRTDAEGIDLNRCYNHPKAVPHIAAQCEIIHRMHFDLALILHEDYDARGAYVYETSAARPHLAEEILHAMNLHVPRDSRRMIDGSRARKGVIRRRVACDTLPEWPEAFFLHFGHASRTFTIETPSEEAIEKRVAAHRAAIESAIAACKRHLCNRPRHS